MSMGWIIFFAAVVFVACIFKTAIEESYDPIPTDVVRAKLVDKSSDTRPIGNDSAETRHSATFELENGERRTFYVRYSDARNLVVGDVGELRYAKSHFIGPLQRDGLRFVGFIREPGGQLEQRVNDAYRSDQTNYQLPPSQSQQSDQWPTR